MKNHNCILSESKYPVNTRNARFVVYVNGAHIKIKLKPGQELRWSKSEMTEEGNSWQGEYWELDNGIVKRTWAHGGRDCDGTYKEIGNSYCRFNNLRSRVCGEHEEVRAPEWESGRIKVYDEYAVASNY